MNNKFTGMFLFGVCCTMFVGSLIVQDKLNEADRAARRNKRSAHPARLDEPRQKQASGVSNAQGAARSVEPGVTDSVTVQETIITAPAPKPVAKAAPSVKAEMKWTCKERDLSQGSGSVKECEWSY